MNPILTNRRHLSGGDGGSSSVEVGLLTLVLAATTITVVTTFAQTIGHVMESACADMATTVTTTLPEISAECE